MESGLMLLIKLSAAFCGGVIAWRAINVICKMDLAKRKESYFAWLFFGLSYALLAVAAVGSVLVVLQGPLDWGHVVWLHASAGLILFDRRRRTRDKGLGNSTHLATPTGG